MTKKQFISTIIISTLLLIATIVFLIIAFPQDTEKKTGLSAFPVGSPSYWKDNGSYLTPRGGEGLLITASSTFSNLNATIDGYQETLAEGAFADGDKTKLDNIEANADVTDATNIASSTDGADAKTTPVDADTVGLIDSEASNILKKLSWSNIKATLKTYFDTLYGDMDNPMTTAGDFIYGGTDGAPTRLAKGTASQVLTMNAGATAPEWANASGGGVGESGMRVYKTSDQSFSANTPTKVVFQSTTFDGLTEYDSTNNRFVATNAGRYLVSASLYFASHNRSYGRAIRIYVNGVAVSLNYPPDVYSDRKQTMMINDLISLTADDYVEIYYEHIYSSGSITMSGGETLTFFTVQRVF